MSGKCQPTIKLATTNITSEPPQARVVGTDQVRICSFTFRIPNIRLTTQNKLSLK